MDRAEIIAQVITTFCRLHGIDPTSDSVTELRCVLLSEVSGMLVDQPGIGTDYAEESRRARLGWERDRKRLREQLAKADAAIASLAQSEADHRAAGESEAPAKVDQS